MTKEKLPKNKRLVLLDAHAIIHRAYHALPEFVSSKGVPTGAIYGLSTMLMKIITDLKPDYVVACYDLPEKTFRHEAYGAYKAGRQKADDALVSQLQSSRKLFEAFNIPIYDKPGFEADDMLGTIVEELHKDKNTDIIIASGDMDTLQLVDDKKVQVYTLKKGINDTILYDEQKVEERFGFSAKYLPDFKGLRGDPSDNIIGIKGIGEKTATILIKEFGTVEKMYKSLKSKVKSGKPDEELKKLGITDRIFNLLIEGEEEALFSKTLATIRRDAPINFHLPEKEFNQSVDVSKIDALFNELEFRSLRERARTLFGKGTENQDSRFHGNDMGSGNDKEGENRNDTPEEKKEEIDLLEFRKLGIAVSLLNSEIGNPTEEEIINWGGAKNLEEARKKILAEIKEKNLSYVYEDIELAILPSVIDMENYGVKVDTLYLKKLSNEYHKELSILEKNIYKAAGREFNVNSPKQLGEILLMR